MLKKHGYTFIVLKYQHSAFAGECLNASILLVSPSAHYVAVKTRKSWKRFHDAYPDFDRQAVKSDFAQVARSLEKTGRSWLEQNLLSTSFRASKLVGATIGAPEGSIIWQKEGSGVTSDPAAELEMLFHRLIGRFENEDNHPRRSDEDVFKSISETLSEAEIIGQMTEHTVHSSRGAVRFKRAFKNGIWHCVQPLSFDLGTREGIDRKAARWAGHLLQAQEAQETFKPYFILGKPSTRSHQGAFSEARSLLDASPCNPVVVLEENADEISDRIVHAFRH